MIEDIECSELGGKCLQSPQTYRLLKEAGSSACHRCSFVINKKWGDSSPQMAEYFKRMLED